jgi:hypothetical protein
LKHILILDNDLGFIYWLGEALIEAGRQPWPACSVSDAITVVGSDPRVPLDAVIVNPSLRGAAGLIALCRQNRANLKVIALGARDGKGFPGITAWHKKPTPGDPSARREWVREIDRSCRSSRVRSKVCAKNSRLFWPLQPSVRLTAASAG